jgi:hypothetical protein
MHVSNDQTINEIHGILKCSIRLTTVKKSYDLLYNYIEFDLIHGDTEFQKRLPIPDAHKFVLSTTRNRSRRHVCIIFEVKCNRTFHENSSRSDSKKLF